MAHVAFSSTARSDLRKIISDLQQRAGPTVAIKYIDEFDEMFERLGSYPGIGAPRGKFGRHVRMLVVAPYLIFYAGTPKAKAVSVLRIFHGRRRITRCMVASGQEDDSG